MELTMTNSFGFCELNDQEMLMVDGGGMLEWASVVGGAYSLAYAACDVAVKAKVAGVVVTAIASNPVVGVTALIVGAVSLGVGIYTAVNS